MGGNRDIWTRRRRARFARLAYAMNMRAAEATVSNVPTAMKTFPINDVLSRVELSLLALSDIGLEVEAITTPWVAGVGAEGDSCNARSASLSWSEASTGVPASAGLSAVAADMPLALSGDASAAVICAFALASQPGTAGGAAPLASATCFSSTCLPSVDFDAVPVDLRWA